MADVKDGWQGGEGTAVEKIAILALGAHEQHGPHLPFETDSLIARGVIDRLKIALSARNDIEFLPVEPVGYSIEHMDSEGTRSLSHSEAIERWLAIAGDLARKGTRKLVLVNAHGGNSPLMTVVATEARVRFDMLCVATSWTRFGQPDGFLTDEEKAIDIHGGDIETSVMLALCPDLVDMSQAGNFASRQSEFIRNFTHLRAYGPHAFGWKMTDLNPQGVTGNAAKASAQKGERFLAHAIKGLIELIEDVTRFDVDRLK